MERHADPAAHDQPVDQRNIRLRIALDVGVETIFLAVEGGEGGRAGKAKGMERPDIAAGRESAGTIGANGDMRHGPVVGPGCELAVNPAHHLQRQGVEGFRAVQGDEAGMSLPLEGDLG